MRFFLLIFMLIQAFAIPALAQNNSLNDDLIYRINFGSTDDVRVLLSKGADPNARSRQGETALSMAMERNDNESGKMVLALVEGGANIQTPDKDGDLPIHTAINYKLTNVVKLMIDKGVSIHTRAKDNTTLVDYAKRNGTPEMVSYIQALLDKERADAESLRTPERFHEFVRQYTLASCRYQYWSYFLSSRQSPEKDDETKKKVDGIKTDLYHIISQIQQYYASSSIDAMAKVANVAVKDVYNQLDEMISNTNRAENGVGREEDAKTRCEKIMETLPIQTIPVAVNPITEAPAATTGSSSSQSAPLPIDPALNSSGASKANVH